MYAMIFLEVSVHFGYISLYPATSYTQNISGSISAFRLHTSISWYIL